MFAPEWRPQTQCSDSPQYSATSTAELSPAAQLHLLRTLLEVKQSWREPHDALYPELDAVREELFWTSTDHDPNSCLFESLGTFLVQVLGVLSQLSIGLTNGPHIDKYHESYISTIGEHNDYADVPAVSAFLDRKSALLEQISAGLTGLSTECEDLWGSRPMPKSSWRLPAHPSPHPRKQGQATYQGHTQVAFPLRSSTSSSTPPPQTSANNMSQSAITALTQEDQRSLLSRGKGKHTCPHGRACDKGGISASGTPLVFERNSAFRAHMAKHNKHFRCDLPGCPNKTGFAREDQLERHKKTVRHHG